MSKDPYIVPEEAPLTILDSKSSVYISKNGKDNKHTRHIERILHLIMNFENCRMQNIGWCEGGMKLADIYTRNVGENDLNPRIKYIMVRLDNWDRTLVQEGWHNTG